MATKPTTRPRLWAINGVYATGPFIGAVSVSDPGNGIAGEGHRPGASFPTAAEHENFQQQQLTTWVSTWLYLGSSAGAADAHIVETNTAGRATVHGANVTNTGNETALLVSSVDPLLPTASFANTAGATIVTAQMGNAAGVGFSAPVGTGAGTGFSATLIGTASGGRGIVASLIGALFGTYGIEVTADAASVGGGIRSTHAGGGYAMEAVSTGILPAFVASALASSPSAVWISGGSTSALFVNSGTGAAADAVVATTSNATGYAFRASVSGAATATARGYYASVGGSAIAAEFVSLANHALIVTGDITSPVFGALKITECNARPTNSAAGQLAVVRSAMGVAAQLMESCPEDGGWRGYLSTAGGSALSQVYDAPGTTANAFGTWYTATPFAAINGNAPKAAGKVLVRINLSARSNIEAKDATLGLRIRDMTAPGAPTVWSRFGIGSGDEAGWRLIGTTPTCWTAPMSIMVPITVPAAGGRLWLLEFQTAGPAGIAIRDVSVDFLGML